MDLSKLSEAELNSLQYKEEKKYADLIRNSSPFSDERGKITAEAYARIARFVDERCTRSGGLHAYGAQEIYVSFIRSAFCHLREHAAENRDLVFYEAGVGTGAILHSLSNEKGVRFYGCDVYLTEELKRKFPDLHETTLIRSLRSLPDHSIDVIYWNDVMEHMPVDEVDTILQLFAEKCSLDGLILTVTPSRYSGPHDITRLADPQAREAHGLHLKEYSLKEVLQKYQKNGLVPAGRIRGNGISFSHVGLYYFIRVLEEEFFHSRILSRLIPAGIKKKFTYINTTVAKPAK